MYSSPSVRASRAHLRSVASTPARTAAGSAAQKLFASYGCASAAAPRLTLN
jgi:hypothetical protein